MNRFEDLQAFVVVVDYIVADRAHGVIECTAID